MDWVFSGIMFFAVLGAYCFARFRVGPWHVLTGYLMRVLPLPGLESLVLAVLTAVVFLALAGKVGLLEIPGSYWKELMFFGPIVLAYYKGNRDWVASAEKNPPS